MRVHEARVPFLALLLVAGFALPAWALDLAAVEGDWQVKGTSSQNGAYTGTVKLAKRPDGRVDVTEALVYSTGAKNGFSATGDVQGDKIVFKGKTSSGFVGIFGFGNTKLKVTGSYALAADKLNGAWATSKENANEVLSRAPVTAGIITLIDGNGAEVPAAKKLTDGVVLAPNNDDDDKDSPTGDGVVNVVPDSQDSVVPGEDDLLPFKLKAGPGGSTQQYRLDYGPSIAVWKSADKSKGKVASGSTVAALDTTLYAEGVAASDGETLTVSLLSGANVVVTDRALFKVARSAYLMLGHGNAGGWALQSWLDQKKLDKRKNPTLVIGKDEKSGKPVAWAVSILRTEKDAKLAFATPGSVIAYDGHSNFGLGYAFETNYSNVRQFMNIADAQVPVNWPYLREHQEHPNLMFADSDYADDKSTPTPYDPVQIDRTVIGAHGNYDTIRFPESGGNGPRCTLTRGDVKWHDYHYGSGENIRIVVKAGSRDMPAKKWSKIFLNSCYSGQYYFDSFGGAGTLFFTHDESSSPQTSYLFIRGCVEGKSNDKITADLNAEENINDYHVFGP
jgi:hypothetical protein